MKLSQMVNPLYIYRRRDHIIPYLYKRTTGLLRTTRRRLAPLGVPKSQNDKRLADLRNKHKGQRCFIIGNGPSLTVADLNRLRGEITFASNKIYLIFDESDFRPTYYTVEDELVAVTNADRINSLDQVGMLKIFPEDLRYWLTPGPEMLYVPMQRGGRHFPSFSGDANDKIYWGSTVMYMGIQLAWHMGIREIYLIGADFSFSAPEQVDGNVITSTGEVNHFHRDYRKPGERWNLPRLDLQEQSFTEAKRFVEAHGGKIYNATRGGKLEVFPRVEFDQLWRNS